MSVESLDCEKISGVIPESLFHKMTTKVEHVSIMEVLVHGVLSQVIRVLIPGSLIAQRVDVMDNVIGQIAIDGSQYAALGNGSKHFSRTESNEILLLTG